MGECSGKAFGGAEIFDKRGDEFLSFTTTNWNTAQEVKVKGHDDGNAADESLEITHTISGGGYESASVPL